MKSRRIPLPIWATILATSVQAHARWDMLRRGIYADIDLAPSQSSLSTTANATLTPMIFPPNGTATETPTTPTTPTTQFPQAIVQSPIPQNLEDANSAIIASPPSILYTPSNTAETIHTFTVTPLPQTPYSNATESPAETPDSPPHFTPTTVTPTSSSDAKPSCTPLDDSAPFTVWSVVFTQTITFDGNSTDYTPPYSTLHVPTYCDDEQTTTTDHVSGEMPEPTMAPIAPPFSDGLAGQPSWWTQSDDGFGEPAPSSQGRLQGSSTGRDRLAAPERPTLTFITTDKNPSVVFPTTEPPSFSQPGSGRNGHSIGKHISAVPDGSGNGNQGVPLRGTTALPVFTVTADRSSVIINTQTFKNLLPGQTSTVEVDHVTFTILPTAVVGQGNTIAKPAPQPTTSPSSAQDASSGTADIADNADNADNIGNAGNVGNSDNTGDTDNAGDAGNTGSSSDTGSAGSIGNQDGIDDPEAALAQVPTTGGDSPAPASPTAHMVVAGGQILTAIGPTIMVLHSTTYTYGSSHASTTVKVDDETITLAPAGIELQGITMGGTAAAETLTRYQVVGGATITQLNPSTLIINGQTITIGSAIPETTVDIGGQELTIGFYGVMMQDSQTILAIANHAVTTTLKPSGTWASSGFAVETGDSSSNHAHDDEGKDSNGGGDEDWGATVRPNVYIITMALSIAIGVWALI